MVVYLFEKYKTPSQTKSSHSQSTTCTVMYTERLILDIQNPIFSYQKAQTAQSLFLNLSCFLSDEYGSLQFQKLNSMSMHSHIWKLK